jgi:hypothetical protein
MTESSESRTNTTQSPGLQPGLFFSAGGSSRRRRGLKPAAPILGATLALSLAACSSGSRVASENDRLRLKNLELTKQVEGLTLERSELKAKLAEANRARESALAPDVLDAIPRCAGIEIDSLSGWTPTDRSAPVTGAVIYLLPKDGRGRFVQIVGTLTVDATVLPQSGATSNQVPIQTKTLVPAELRESYRSGFMGTGYTIELPIPTNPAARSSTLVLRARFVDALTGQTWSAERTVSPK